MDELVSPWRNRNMHGELSRKARHAVFAVIVAQPRLPPRALTIAVRAAFKERGLPLDGHDLNFTLEGLLRRGTIENVGGPGNRAMYVVSAEQEAKYVAHVQARAAGLPSAYQRES